MKSISLDIYNENGDVERTETINFIPWKLTKDLIKAQKQVNNEPEAEKTMEIIENMVIRAFNGKITKKDLEMVDIGSVPQVFTQLGERLQGR